MLRRSGYNDAIGRSKRDQKIDSEEIVKLLRPFERRLAPDEHSPPFAPTTSASLPMSRALTLPANTPLDAERLDDVDEILSNEQRFADKLAATAVDNGRQNSPAETTAMHRCAIRGSLDLQTRTALRNARVLGPPPLSVTTDRLLEEFFSASRDPNAAECTFLSSRLGVDEQQIKVWFANKRAKSHASFVALETVGGDSEVARMFRMRREELTTRPPPQKKPLWVV